MPKLIGSGMSCIRENLCFSFFGWMAKITQGYYIKCRFRASHTVALQPENAGSNLVHWKEISLKKFHIVRVAGKKNFFSLYGIIFST